MHNLAKCLLTGVFALITLAATAQISIGPRVGVTLAKWSLNEDELADFGDIKNRSGLLAGVVAEIRLNDNFAIQPEINFMQKGFKSEYSEVDSIFGSLEEKTNAVINYLEVPVLLKAGASFGPARVDVLAGPSFGYGLNGKVKYEFTFDGETEKEEEDIDFEDDEISRLDLGLQFGAAVTFGLGERANIFVDGRYLLGLTNLNDSGDDDIKAYNRGIALSAGVLFSLN